MGFAGMAALTHQMEDVFELLRQRSGGLPREAIDVLLECLDALAAAVDAIDETGEEDLDPEPLIERLQGPRARARRAEQEVDAGAGCRGPDRPRRAGRRPPGRRSQRALSEDVQMPVRARVHGAHRAGRARRDAGLQPTPDEVETFDGREIEAWMVSERDRRRAGGRRGSVSDVDHVEVSEAVSDAAVDDGEVSEEVSPPRRRRRARRRGADRPRAAQGRHNKGSTTVRVDAERLDQLMHFMGELVVHRTHVESLAAHADVPGPLAGDAEPDAHVARAAGDGHAGADDPRRGRLPALPAPRARPLGQARQAGRARARRQGHRARPHRRRRARRPARAPRPQRARPRPGGARRARRRRQAGDRHAADLRPATPAATSSSRSATTAAASTPPRSPRRRSSAA